MSCEIEIKAHLNECEVEDLLSKLKNMENSSYLGPIEKSDIYWSTKDSDIPLFRSRLELNNGKTEIYFTSKPLKKKDYEVEYNIENEISVCSDQWNNILDFCNGLGLEICRKKSKTGFHFNITYNGYSIHCEILNVKYLGWFIESEIIGDNLNSINTDLVEKTLYSFLDYLQVPSQQIEPKGYNKLLKAAGHEKG